MSGDFLPSTVHMPMHLFEAWRDSRPDEERWQLIDGVPMMMPPPTLVHQRIASNLERALEARLDVVQNGMAVAREIGIKLPDVLNYLPEPDVAVIDADIRLGQVYAERFYVIAEVLSDSESAKLIDAKLGFYKGHADCVAVLLVRQDAVHITTHERSPQGGWQVRAIAGLDAELGLPTLGSVCRLMALYRGTPLAAT
jgi:Uma2 family endonuclease